MPTYVNNTNSDVVVQSANGQQVRFLAGETKITDLILSDPDITMSSESPYYNPLAARGTVSVIVAGPTV